MEERYDVSSVEGTWEVARKFAEELKGRDDRIRQLEEDLGKLDLAHRPEFRHQYDEPMSAVADEFVLWYDKLYRTATLRPGIVDFLDRRKGEGYWQVLLSATRCDQLVEQVAAFGDVGDRFERKLGLTDHYAFSKAALARDFIEREGIPRERTLFIGDTDHDFEVSSAIGCPCVLLEGGHQSRARLEAMGVPVLPDLAALGDYLDRL